MAWRNLTADEIRILEDRGCRCAAWSRVTVAGDFTPGDAFHSVRFSGDVRLGSCSGTVRTADGFAFPSGICDSVLHDVTIGGNCLVRHADLACADLGDNVAVEHAVCVFRSGDDSFAASSFANVLAEDGARAVPLWRGMTAQLAHLVCHLKGHSAVGKLEGLMLRDAEEYRLRRSVISSGCRVSRVGRMRNVWLGEGAEVVGAAVLEDCRVDSSPAAPARIGEGVAAVDCVFLRGSETSGGTRLEHCLIGEGVRLGNSFSGKHSLFFANSEFALGEAACAMAGPFAVSHHKATLVLACQCSFNTFGSAANSSNHHFKLGPRHGGVLRRGAKCGSGSYLFWPSDIGAFSTVVGRHAVHLDTSRFPFSLLTVKNDASVLIPGVNLFSAGLFRDALKWRGRDRRSAVDRPRDLVNPAILSPYVLEAMEEGLGILDACAGAGADVGHGGAVIPAARVEPARRLYEAAITFHIGERVIFHARAAKADGRLTPGDLARVIRDAAMEPDPMEGAWRDWGGMLLPGAEAERFLADVADGGLSAAESIRERLEAVHARYDQYELAWLARHWRWRHGEPSPESVAAFVEKWRGAVCFRHECLVRDATKEFSDEAMLGYGVEEDAGASFRRVRGGLGDHPLLALAEAERERLLALAELGS